MSTPPVRSPVKLVFSEIVTDPAEIAASEARPCFPAKGTAAREIGFWMVIDAPLPQLARYIAELDSADQQEFLRELFARLPLDAVAPLADALRARLDAPAA